jgi:hypothetical protein
VLTSGEAPLVRAGGGGPKVGSGASTATARPGSFTPPVGQIMMPEDRHATVTVSPRAPCARLCLRPPFRLTKFDVNFSLSGVHWVLLASAWPASAPQF